jgi:ribonuclease HI
MKKTKNLFYVVWKGIHPGIYDSWDKCKKQVEGYTGARYKGFSSIEEATKALHSGPNGYFKKEVVSKTDPAIQKRVGQPVRESICVDAACSGNPGILEYRGVYFPTGEEIFRRGPFPEGTTNIGEFLAIVTGLLWLQQKKLSIPLYSDSRTGLIWVRQKRINTKLTRTAKNEELFQIVEKALEWLHNNSIPIQLLKWETSVWGEIPADFGRK